MKPDKTFNLKCWVGPDFAGLYDQDEEIQIYCDLQWSTSNLEITIDLGGDLLEHLSSCRICWIDLHSKSTIDSYLKLTLRAPLIPI